LELLEKLQKEEWRRGKVDEKEVIMRKVGKLEGKYFLKNNKSKINLS